MSDQILSFIYRDAKGIITFREVFDISESDVYLQAMCLKARALRTFRKDRILETIKDSSGVEEKLEFYKSKFPKPEESATHSKSRSNRDHKPEICFTGFKKNEKQQLIELAESSSFFVRTAVTANLHYLCCGSTAGPKKIEKARAQGVIALSKNQFESLVEFGEIPEE
ncbi:hypothetical protein EGM51_09860 [Verrucomicrobia bacterium S94]|nr:hypothetical protein EGM51_09860 [Verrucomicrobia bacterium S94]